MPQEKTSLVGVTSAHEKVLNRAVPALLFVCLLIGFVLRFIWSGDMEYKLDEQYMFERVAKLGQEPFPWLGMPSGVQMLNPGMSIWFFIALGKLIGASDPVELCQGVMALNCVAILLVVVFAYRWVTKEEREPWLWAAVLVSFNPIALHFQRKIWAQSVLPIISMFFLMSWWKRDRKWGAFFLGLIGALIGQVHMSGFFFALGFVLWGLLLDRKNIRWKSWFVGSCVGSLTLLNWVNYVLFQRGTGGGQKFGWDEVLQLKYWVFWITDPLGLHLGKSVGLLEGSAMMKQMADFIRYPLINGSPTYLTGVLHVALVILGCAILLPPFYQILKRPRAWFQLATRKTPTVFAQNAALFSYGIVMTLSKLQVRRYYMIITFPLQFVWLARMALSQSNLRRARGLLALLSLVELGVSINYLAYIHENGGAPRGDYGQAYRLQTALPIPGGTTPTRATSTGLE